MNTENSHKESQGSEVTKTAKKTRIGTWIIVIAVVIAIVIGFALIMDWDNFTNGLGGKSEVTNP